MPFALANNVEAVATQAPDLPGYDAADTLFPFGHGLTYADPFETLSSSLEGHIASGDVAGPIAKQLTQALEQASTHADAGRTQPATVALERFLALLEKPKKPDTLTPEAQDDLRTQAQHLLRRL